MARGDAEIAWPQRLDAGDLILLHRSGLFDAEWIAERHPDLAGAGVDALTHFHRYGWREGRWPNPYFDTGWYLAQNRDVRDSGADPLLHYIEHGEAEGRPPIGYFEPQWYRRRYGVPAGMLCLAHFLANRRAGLVSPIPEFDAAFYLRHAPDVAQAGMDPFEHYLVQGAMEDRRPSAAFDPVFYRARYLRHLPDVNPLLHFRQHRHEAGVFPSQPEDETGIAQEVRRHTQPGPSFEEVVPLRPDAPRRAKLLAFYLPQFHAVPSNDAWWGKGFTEWTNVARGLPRFAGHYQPRIPRDLGHYRLDAEVLRRQAEMAQGAGLHGFVFYFYWFNGQRLLDAPLEILLGDPSIDLPFCLMWANENWTRRWDGGDDEVLIAQDYRDADEPGLIAAFVRHFADPRYIRLGGRPVLMVYRAGLIPNTAAAVARWRRLFGEAGHDPVFVMAQSFTERDPRPFGMDAAVEFPPHKLTDGLQPVNAGLRMLDHAATARVYAYDDVAASSELMPPGFPLIRTAVPGWDNDARRQGAGMVLHGASPGAYQAWLGRLIDTALAQPVAGEAVVCINAWNEWAEGAYLEPDLHFGAAFLNATARAAEGQALPQLRPRLLLVGHDAFAAGSQLLLLHLGRRLREQGRVEVAFLLMGGGALLDQYRAVAPTTVAGSVADLSRQAQVLRARGFDAAVVNSAASGIACERLAAAGVACTLLVHELPRLLRDRGLVDAARAGAHAAAHVVFPASYVQDRFQKLVALPPGRGAVLPQGLYRPVRPGFTRDALRIPAEATLAIALGHADLRKGFDLFLHAWRIAQGDGPVHFLWVGNLARGVQAYLEPEVAAATATGTFHHLPWQDDGADWLAVADVHLLTSREDPFPSVVLEAMSAGVPTVAFEESGGAPDLLRERGAGEVVALGDVTAMVQALRRLAAGAGPAVRSRLAEATRRDYRFEDYAERVLQLACPAVSAVSAIVPTFQYGHYLPGRLASIFAQTRVPAEIVVLDDGSTDGSAGIVRRVSAGRAVRWEGSARNSGSVFQQWRRAAATAEHALVWLAEADDLAEPGLLAALVRALQAAPDVAFAFCDSRAVDADGTPLWADHQGYYAEAEAPLLAQDGVLAGPEALGQVLGARNLILNASAVLWRRDALRAALERCGPALDGFRVAGDWLVYAQAMAATGATYVAQPLNVHRRHGTSATGRLPPAAHLDEIKRMQAHMRGVLGSSPALLRRQRAALAAARRALGVPRGTAVR